MCPHGQGEDRRTSDAEERALREIVGRLTLDYPDVPLGQVEAIVRFAFERTSGARVQQYRLVLAERDARVRLRMDQRRMPPVPAGRRDEQPGRTFDGLGDRTSGSVPARRPRRGRPRRGAGGAHPATIDPSGTPVPDSITEPLAWWKRPQHESDQPA